MTKLLSPDGLDIIGIVASNRAIYHLTEVERMPDDSLRTRYEFSPDLEHDLVYTADGVVLYQSEDGALWRPEEIAIEGEALREEVEKPREPAGAALAFTMRQILVAATDDDADPADTLEAIRDLAKEALGV